MMPASFIKTCCWWLVERLPFAWQDRAAALVRRIWPGVRDA